MNEENRNKRVSTFNRVNSEQFPRTTMSRTTILFPKPLVDGHCNFFVPPHYRKCEMMTPEESEPKKINVTINARPFSNQRSYEELRGFTEQTVHDCSKNKEDEVSSASDETEKETFDRFGGSLKTCKHLELCSFIGRDLAPAIAAAKKGCARCLEVFFRKCAYDVNSDDFFNIVEAALKNDQFQCVEYLLQKKTEKKTNILERCFYLALSTGKRDFVELLISRINDVDFKRAVQLWIASEGNVRGLRVILRHFFEVVLKLIISSDKQNVENQKLIQLLIETLDRDDDDESNESEAGGGYKIPETDKHKEEQNDKDDEEKKNEDDSQENDEKKSNFYQLLSKGGEIVWDGFHTMFSRLVYQKQ